MQEFCIVMLTVYSKFEFGENGVFLAQVYGDSVDISVENC